MCAKVLATHPGPRDDARVTRRHPEPTLSPHELVSAYAQGAFPMANPDTGRVDYFICDPRAVFEVVSWVAPARLARTLRSGRFSVRFNTAFEAVLAGCATDRSAENPSWIGDRIQSAFRELHRLGIAHSVEAWVDDRLAGGLYGVALGGVFFGESMFTVREPWARDASKVAFAGLMARLRTRGFVLVDSQYANPHVVSLGAVEIPLSDYRARLDAAITMPVGFD